MRTQGALLLERDRELTTIDGAIEKAQGGSGQLLVIDGAQGLGKTSLLGALRDRASGRGFKVLQARSIEFERGFPYGVVRQLFEDWISSMGPVERHRILSGPAKLAAPLFDYGEARALNGDDGEGQYSSLHGLYWMCVHLAEIAPIVLVIDDIELVDLPSLRFLHYLAARLDDHPILLAVSTDPTEGGLPSAISRAITAHPVAQLLLLEPLTRTGVKEYLTETLGSAAATRYAAVCHEATGGIPFLLCELVGELILAEKEQSDFTPAHVAVLAPPKVVRLVLRRLDRLQPTATALIEAMAVLGTEADLKHAVEVAGLDQHAVPEAQGALADVGLLRPDLPPRFVHSIVRAAVYRNLSVRARNGAHARAARVLAAADAPADVVAGHLMRAPATGDAETVGMLREAARKAVADQQDMTAVAHLARALQEPPAPDVLPCVLVELGRAELRAHLREGIDHLSQAMELIQDPLIRGHVGLDLVGALTASARSEEAVTLLERLRSEARLAKDQEYAALLDAVLLSTAQQIPGLRPAAQRQLQYLEVTESAHPSLGHLRAIERAAEALRRGEPIGGVMAVAEDMLKQTFTEGPSLLIHDAASYPWCLAAFVLTQCDRLDDADRLLTILVDGALQRGMMTAADIGYCLRAWVRATVGRLAEAETDARRVLDHAQAADVSGAAACAAAALAQVLISRQDIGQARLLLDQYGSADAGDSVLSVPVTLAKGRLYAAQGKIDAAVAILGRGGRLLEERDLRQPALARANETASILARAGRITEAQELADIRLARARDFGAPRMIAGALRVCGLTAQGPLAVKHFQEAVDVLAGTEARLDRAAAFVDLGAALRLEGRPEQARAELTKGMERAQSCGAWGLAKTARAELAAMGVRVRITKTTGVDGLTAQERRVAVLAAKGKSNREIADTLFVTIKTVEWHLNRAYRKLGIASRSELVGALFGEFAGTR